MRQDKFSKAHLTLYACGIIPVVWLALLLAPYMDGGLVRLVQYGGAALEHPFRMIWCEDSLKTVLIFLLCYGLGIGAYLSTDRNYRRREEHGSAKWGVPAVLNKKYADRTPLDNKILTRNVSIGLDGRKHRRTCLILSLGIAGPLIQATYYADNFAVVDASIRQVGNFLDEQELVRPSKEVLLTDDGFHFEHVSFGYDKKEVLHDITFSPVPGGKTAIVGPSGSGKSTITKLMAGFWDVTSGHIIYGCQDIRNIPTSQLMKHISFVSQDNFLFNISIKENIRMGNPCATDEEVLAAAKAARCDEFIRKMEYGYDTLVGDAGGKLSGGERQRITIARAILKPADVVILDEASAYADPENEVYIEEAINELVKDKTLIVVAHRLETIENSDKIVVVDQGKIVAEGTQSELLKNCALYKRLWNETILTSERKRGECNA